MAATHANELEVQQKQELVGNEEQTVPARFYVPVTDIYETEDALTVVVEMPGVRKDNIDIQINNDVLNIEGRLELGNYKDMEPIYTEYNVGHYTRRFALSNKVDQSKISASVDDGVLTLTLPKAEESKPRTIQIS